MILNDLDNNKSKLSQPVLRTVFDTNTIKLTVNKIQETLQKLINEGSTDSYENEIKILDLYSDFYDNYPFLVKKICKQDDMSFFYKMLDNLDQVEKGNQTLNNVELNLGKELATEYLYPNL